MQLKGMDGDAHARRPKGTSHGGLAPVRESSAGTVGKVAGSSKSIVPSRLSLIPADAGEGHAQEGKKGRVWPQPRGRTAVPSGRGAKAWLSRRATEKEGFQSAWGDLAWRALNSDYWAAVLIVLSLLVVLFRPVSWFTVMGPGSRDHVRVTGAAAFFSLCFLHACNSAAYHFLARSRLDAPAQKYILRKLLVWELLASSIGGLTLLLMFIFGLSHDDDNNQYGEGVQSIAGFQGIWMPVTGVLGMPMLVLSFTTPVRKRILPKMGEDIFSIKTLQTSLVLSLVVGAVGILFFLVLAVLLVSRYPEFGFRGHFGPRIPFEVEAQLGARMLLMTQPQSPSDISEFAAVYASSGAPLRLAWAEIETSPGIRVSWESPELGRGEIARVVQVALPGSAFLFSTDPLNSAISAWDPVVAALFALACVAFLLCSASSTRSLVVSPLESMLSALVDAAGIIDSQGRVTRHPDKPRLPLGHAVRRILAHISVSSRAATRLTQSDAVNTMANRESRASRGSILRLSGGEGDLWAVDASSLSGRGADWTRGGSGPHSVGESNEPMQGTLPNLEQAGQRRRPSMKFTPTVLNKLGSPEWNPKTFVETELVPACHLIFIKTRIPEVICEREPFVGFAEKVLERHPEMRFHNRRRAVGNMHAAYSLMRSRDFAVGHLRSLAVLVSALAMDICSLGRDDEELCAEGHPLAVTYAFHRPQKQAAVAEVFRIAAQEGCNIFSALGPADVAKLREYIRMCILVTSPAALSGLTNQLRVLKSQFVLSAVEVQAHTPRDRKSPVGLHALLASREIPSIARAAPDVAMEAVMAMAVVHQGWIGSSRWRAEEERRIQQQLDSLRARPDGGMLLASKTEELWGRRKDFWVSMVNPFMQSLAAICPSAAIHASTIESIANDPDSFSPTSSQNQP